VKKQPSKTIPPATLKAVLSWILAANDEPDIKEAIRKEYPDSN